MLYTLLNFNVCIFYINGKENLTICTKEKILAVLCKEMLYKVHKYFFLNYRFNL